MPGTGGEGTGCRCQNALPAKKFRVMYNYFTNRALVFSLGLKRAKDVGHFENLTLILFFCQ